MNIFKRMFLRKVIEHDNVIVYHNVFTKKTTLKFKKGLEIPPQSTAQVDLITGNIKIIPIKPNDIKIT